MKAKRQIESSLNSVTMLDGSGGHVTWFFEPVGVRSVTVAPERAPLASLTVPEIVSC
jgi:hypothetical protein